MMATILLVLTVAGMVGMAVTPSRAGARHRRRPRTAAALDWMRAVPSPASTVAQEQPVVSLECGGDTQDSDAEAQGSDVDTTLGERLCTATQIGAADFETYGRRVGTVIRALGADLESAEMPEALARVCAGIDRLVVREPFARPVLTVARDHPAAPVGARADAPAILSDAPVGSLPAEVVDADAAQPTVAEPTDAEPTDAESAAVEPLPEADATPETVYPVPPPAKAPSKRRSRWAIRGRAA